nr:nidogen-1-like isoform X2 [Misgurnus anguillicaudatus]
MSLLCTLGFVALLVSVQCVTKDQIFDYGIKFGDQILDAGSDSLFELKLNQTLFFFKEKFDSVYVSTNGFISLDKPTDESEYLRNAHPRFKMIATFLGDLDTSDEFGKVYFREDNSPDVLDRASNHIAEAFPDDDEWNEPSYVLIITWENVSAHSQTGRGDELHNVRNTFQLVVANTDSASYAILLYPEDGLRFVSTRVDGEDQPVRVGFSEGLIPGWFGFSSRQGSYYEITDGSEESVKALTQNTNSGTRGIWVYEIGTSPLFTSITPGKATETTPDSDTPVPETDTLTPETDTLFPDTDTPTPEPDTPTPDPDTAFSEPDTPFPVTDKPTPETDTWFPDTDTPTPETDTPFPETDTPTPETDTPTPETDTPTPETDTPTPEMDTWFPDTDTLTPETDTPTPEMDTWFSDTDTPTPEADMWFPKTDKPTPETDTPTPEMDTWFSDTDTPTPEADMWFPKTDTPTPETETQTPEADTPTPETHTPISVTVTPAPKTFTPFIFYEEVQTIEQVPFTRPVTEQQVLLAEDQSKSHYPQPRRPALPPPNPQIVVIDGDVDVNVFEYNVEKCSSNAHKCSVFADCKDYSNGYCCHCQPGYYGNGKECVAEGKPQRMNGKVNGRVYVGNSPSPVEFSNNDLHSYVVTNDGRAYIAISSVPGSIGPSLQPLPSLGGTIGWAFALEQPNYQNGFSIIGGVFNRQAEVTFQPGNEKLTIRQEFKGINEHDHLVINTELDGRIPEVPQGATVQIEPYTEIYQYSSSYITSSSRRDYTVNMPDGSVQMRSYMWKQSITFKSCPHEALSVPPSQQLSVDQIFVMYDAGNQLIRYAMSNKIGSVHSGTPEQNPCFTGRHGCDTNAVCRPGQEKDFTCECAAGFNGDGRICYDIDECSETPQVCGAYTTCINQPGSFRCECLDGFQFAADGRTCVELNRPVDHCRRGTHDCDGPDRARCSYTGGSTYSCSCRPGFSGDGRNCQDIDECQSVHCHSDAICYNTQGSFTCQCRPGFHGDGFSCSPDSDREKTSCERHRESVLYASSSSGVFRPRPAVGQYVPTCDDYGAYEPTQCHASIGQCWCVDGSGLEIPGSRTRAGSRPLCIDHNVAPPIIGPTPRPDITPLTPGANLLFAQSGRIEHIPLDGERMNKDGAMTVLHVPDKVVIAVAYDCVEKMIYWSDITQPAISRVNMEGGQTITLVNTDLGSPEGIAIDHLSRNMYWTDSVLDRIEVSRLDGSHRRVLFDKDLINPRPIIADPVYGLLYWADWNRDGPKIERSNMDGTDRTVLVNDDLALPNGLTYDPARRELCWADAGTRKVECIDPYSRIRRKVTEGIQYPFAVVSYGKNLFYTDWRREAVVAVDRQDGTEVEEFLPQRRSRTYGIAVTYPQCPQGLNYCHRDNGGCSHLCLPRPGGFTCRCPDVRDLSCVEQDENF